MDQLSAAQPPQFSAAQTDTMIHSLFRSNHQLGVTARFASAISQITDTICPGRGYPVSAD